VSDVDARVLAFGEWDAPVTDDAQWIAAPIDERCMYCHEHFKPEDNGCIYPTGWAAHRECSLRSVLGGIGHLVAHAHYCRGLGDPDAGLGFRKSAWLVWSWHVDGGRLTLDELEQLRSLEATTEGDT
jgi:hypothetical protein